MKRPLPPDLVDLGDELERSVREHVVDAPRRRQLALGILATFVITVPMAISLTSAELSRPASQLDPDADGRPVSLGATDPSPPSASRAADELLRRQLRTFTITAVPTPYPSEPTPLKPNLR